MVFTGKISVYIVPDSAPNPGLVQKHKRIQQFIQAATGGQSNTAVQGLFPGQA